MSQHDEFYPPTQPIIPKQTDKERQIELDKFNRLLHMGVLSQKETLTTDPITGGQKGTKLQRFSLIPPEFLWALAEHYGKGAQKYADRNWEKGYAWSKTVDALERHLTAWKMGEWVDPETGSSHMIAVAWHAIALFIFKLRGIGTDDITPKKPAINIPTIWFPPTTPTQNTTSGPLTPGSTVPWDPSGPNTYTKGSR